MIRRYQSADINKMLDHIGVFLKESDNYKDIHFEREKMRYLLTANLMNSKFFCNLSMDNDEIIGGLCAQVHEYSFSKECFAADLLFYIPQDRRGLGIATELVESYVSWGKLRNVKEIRLANSTGMRPEAYGKLCERCGFSYLGPIYQMRF